MARCVKDGYGGFRQVARFDTRLLMSPLDIFPDDREIASKLIIKKDSNRDGRPKIWYVVESNSALVRKIFRHCIKNIIDEIISGGCKFTMPYISSGEIYMGHIEQHAVIDRCQNGINNFDLLATGRKMPELRYKVSKNLKKKQLRVYVSRDKYDNLVDRANTGKVFSQRPRGLEYFLPKIYEEFSYLNEKEIGRAHV